MSLALATSLTLALALTTSLALSLTSIVLTLTGGEQVVRRKIERAIALVGIVSCHPGRSE
jgi:hypothetical protein